MSIWFFIGLALIVWVIYDLWVGVTWTYREVYRKYEPIQYWIVSFLWAIIAIVTTVGSL